MPATKDVSNVVGRDESITLPGLDWDQYQAISAAVPEQTGVRMIFVDGRLTFVSPSRRHDWHAEVLGRIVEAVARGFGIAWDVAGHSTYRIEGIGGVEGDKTFYFGEHAILMRGPINIDLSTQPTARPGRRGRIHTPGRRLRDRLGPPRGPRGLAIRHRGRHAGFLASSRRRHLYRLGSKPGVPRAHVQGSPQSARSGRATGPIRLGRRSRWLGPGRPAASDRRGLMRLPRPSPRITRKAFIDER